jgi:porin-like protein
MRTVKPRGYRMKILKYLKNSRVPRGLSIAAALLCARPAAAEVTLVDQAGWRFTFDGRINAFLSVGKGDDFPKPTPGSAGQDHNVMGLSRLGRTPDVGWKSSEQADENGKYFAARIRSGMVGNVLGFGLVRQLTPNTQIKGYISIWSTVESPGRDKWTAVIPVTREGYFNVTAPWGSATVGRTFGWFGRISTEIDMLYGHGYGLGLPCTDELGPACGHIGTGVAYPGYSAGFSYSTPSLGGLQLHAGVYDPIVFTPAWKRAPVLRPEGSLTFEAKLGGNALLKLAAEGTFQPLARLDETTVTDPTTTLTTTVRTNQSTSVWGVAGGGRLEVGPVRLGASVFRGRGVGMTYALQNTTATLNTNTNELRSFTGIYGQTAVMIGKLHVAAGAGVASADQLASDRLDTTLSVIHQQIGVSAALYYHMTENVVLGLDYFRFMARWYGAPKSTLDPNTGNAVLLDGSLLPGEKQDLNFLNAGVTYHW